MSFSVKSEKGGKKKEKEDDKKKVVKGRLQPLPTKGWVHRKNQAHHGGICVYSSSARNPLFISTDGTFDAELVLLTQHFHPSIVVFAQTLIQGKTINYGADPLEDFTTISFLDRFVYRNPKTTVSSKGVLGVQKKGAVGVKALAISSKEYLSKSLHEIPADERFLYRFATLNFAAKMDRKKEDDYDDDAASVNSDEFERVMERFEPGEANDNFDIDFGKEFSSEKQKKKSTKRKISDVDGDENDEENEDGEDDADGWSDEDLEDLDEDEEEEDDDDDNEDEEMEEDEDDEDIEIEGEESDDDYGMVNSKKGKRMDSDESDEDYGENDAFVSADRFAEEMEGFGDEETREQRKERLKKKVKRVKGRKVRK
ncbi:hypothetical protein PRIPAC_73961 [Pristionchus pacificus]|nr:hypothetical protein PRIPAC_73961 [Pristionchus pacificus]